MWGPLCDLCNRCVFRNSEGVLSLLWVANPELWGWIVRIEMAISAHRGSVYFAPKFE